MALLILIYGICHLKTQFPDITYVMVDDDSARSDYIENNIYHSLGFSFRDTIEMDMEKPKTLIMSGPDKQLLLDEKFIQLVYKKLDNIEPTGGKRNRKTKRKL